MLRKIGSLFLGTIMICVLCSCLGTGKTANCRILPIESQIYTQEDYAEACQVVFACFKAFPGCNMTEIKYAGDEKSDVMKNLANAYKADEVILLESTFDTDGKGGDGSLNPNATYTGWQWVLVRNRDGRWQHKDHGYG